ncbi:MAG: S46 family peptidase, partial [Bacteroidales bacterium]
MKKIIIGLVACITLCNVQLKADEGMWLPMFIERLNQVDMHKMGLRLTADEIYSVNHSSLKDAIVQFGGGCTGEMVSSNGLLLTNHHCGYGQIQSHSTLANDYLTDGFWAKTQAEELPNEGLTVKFLVRMEDVTRQVVTALGTKELSEIDRAKKLNVIFDSIEKTAVANTHYIAQVNSFFAGNEFYLFVYEEFEDVRLVGTPPISIGKFGADADNWMWPRHTCDFSVFRVYMGKDGKPAKYSKENIPYQPKQFLTISLSGVKKGDYAMIMGYPGSTQRYLTSFGVDQLVNIQAPTIVDIRRAKLDIMDEFMQADPLVRIQYSSKYAGIANYWKYFMGQEKQLRKNKVTEKKQAIEADFASWAESNVEYKKVLSNLKEAYTKISATEKLKWYTIEGIAKGPEIFAFSNSFKRLLKALESGDTILIQKEVALLKASAPLFFKNYNQALNEKLCTKVFTQYAAEISKDQQPLAFIKWAEKNKNQYDKLTEEIFSKSMMTSMAKVEAFLANPNAKELETDPAYVWMNTFFTNYNERRDKDAEAELQSAQRLFVKGLQLMRENKKNAPDANSTMRLSYGQVLDYVPADAVQYDYKTTLKGVMQKEDPKNPDFIVPEKLKQLYEDGDYGIYATDSNLVTCFLTTNDITGGNSGSP